MTTRTLVLLFPLIALGCGDSPKGDGSDASDGTAGTMDPSAGDATVAPPTTSGSVSGTGTATDSGDPSGDPSGNPSSNPTSDSEGPTSATVTTASETDGCGNIVLNMQ